MSRNKTSGFTLLEVLMVITVIWILAGIVLPSFKGFQNEANITKAESDLHILKTAIESYRRYHGGQLPGNITANLRDAVPRMMTDPLSDPWQTSLSVQAKDGYTYGYVTDNVPGFGPLYVVYSRGVERTGGVEWNAQASLNVVITANNNALAASNAPVR